MMDKFKYINTALIVRKLVVYISIIMLTLTTLTIKVGAIAGGSMDTTFYSGNDILWYDPSAKECSQLETDTIAAVDGPSSVNVAQDFTLGTDKSIRPVNLLKQLMNDFNLKDFQAAGIVGNFMEESGGRWLPPDTNQTPRSNGPPTSDYTSGHAYGWAQWDGGRKLAFVNFSISNHYIKGRASSAKHPTPSTNASATDAANYAYLTHELTETGEGAVLPALKKTTDVVSASTTWRVVFERAGEPHQSLRDGYAKDVLAAYRKGTGISEDGTVDTTSDSATATRGCSPTTTTAGAVGTSESANFGDVAFPLKGSKSVVKNPGIFHDGTTDKGGHPYTAYDIYANHGTEVIAFASGVVTYVSSDICNDPFITIWNEKAKLGVTYMHISSGHIGKGTTVQAGDHIGTVAKGTTTGGEAGCAVEHLHIDVATDKIRQACSRTSCSIQSHFRDIGEDLYNTYEALPGSAGA